MKIYGLLITTILITIGLFALIMLVKTSTLKRNSFRIFQRIEISVKVEKIIRRANLSIEIFLMITGIIIISGIIIVTKYAVLGGEPRALLLFVIPSAIFSLYITSSNEQYKRQAKLDLEKIMRVSYFLERGGTEPKEIYKHLVNSVQGPLNVYMKELYSTFKLIKDQREIFNRMRIEFEDIPELVTYVNISMQKIDTGKSDKMLKTQLKEIKKMKQEKFRLKRHRNRMKMFFMSFLLAGSFLGIVLYPMISDLMNNMSKIIY